MTDEIGEGPIGPRKMAEEIEERLPRLKAQLETATPGEARKLNKLIRINQRILRFCKTRAGY